MDKVAAHSLSIGNFSFLEGAWLHALFAVAEGLDSTRLVARVTSYVEANPIRGAGAGAGECCDYVGCRCRLYARRDSTIKFTQLGILARVFVFAFSSLCFEYILGVGARVSQELNLFVLVFDHVKLQFGKMIRPYKVLTRVVSLKLTPRQLPRWVGVWKAGGRDTCRSHNPHPDIAFASRMNRDF